MADFWDDPWEEQERHARQSAWEDSMREEADALGDKVVRHAAELDSLRRALEHRNADLRAYKGQASRLVRENAALAEDAARLRGRVSSLEALARDMWDGMCGYSHDCRDCDLNVGTYMAPLCSFRRRMGDLGVLPATDGKEEE